jgi:aspartate aminotransferase-like enzyme
MLVREKAIQHARRMEGELNHRLGYTTSLTRIMEFHEKHQTLGTPAVPQIIMLLKTIQKVHGYVSRDGRYIPGEGLDNRYQRVAELARLDKEWAAKAGFSLYPQNGSVCSDTITAINLAPLDSDRIVERLKKNYRIDLSGGHRDLADDTGRKVPLIRIPHMGGMKKADLNYLLRQITRAIIDETGNEHVLMPSLRDAMEWLETDPVWG